MLICSGKNKKENNVYSLKKYNHCFLKILDNIVKANDTILDIGAKRGFYSLYISKIQQQKGKIYSFESDVNNFDKLLKNIFINSVKNITTIKTKDENTFLGNKSCLISNNIDEWAKVNEEENIKLILINSKKPFEIIKTCQNIISNNLPGLYFDFDLLNDDFQKYKLFKYIVEKKSYNIFQIKKHDCNKISKINHAGDLLFCENMLCFNIDSLTQLK
ncbi:MAG: hypothetical protein WC197_08565 [Candidatus Gastranaerophilaceae bacterium]